MAKLSKAVKQHRTRLSALLTVLFLVFAHPTKNTLLLSLPILAAGESMRIWASGYIHKSRELSVTGPFSLCRNPLYLGSFILALGFVVAMGVPWLAMVFLAFFAVVYGFTIRWEEDKMRRRFPEQWAGYESTVPRFLPRAPLTRYIPGEFRWAQVLHNRELWNASVVLVVYAILWVKLLIGHP